MINICYIVVLGSFVLVYYKCIIDMYEIVIFLLK